MGFFSNLYGSKPDVPDLEKLDIGKEQKKAIQNNLAAMPEAQNLVSKANLFSQQQIDQMLAGRGGGNLLSSGASQIEKMIAGEVPLADQQQQQLRSVAKAFGGGTGGSGAMGNLVARDFGLQQMDLTMKGLSSAESWLRTTASLYEPSMMNLSSMFISPMQQYQTDNEQNLQQFQRDWMSEQISAMPDPTVGGMVNFGTEMFGKLVSSVAGFGGGGGLLGGMKGLAGGGGGGNIGAPNMWSGGFLG